MRTPFGNNGLANVGGGIIIEMRGGANELGRPILGPHTSIAPWCKLQVAVGAEMDECVCKESPLHIEICGKVVMRRWYLCAMLESEVIVAQYGTWLQKQQDVAVTCGGDGYVGDCRSVDGVHLC